MRRKLCTVCSWTENQECTTLWHSCGILLRSIGNQADIHKIQHGMDSETEATTWRVDFSICKDLQPLLQPGCKTVKVQQATLSV